MRRWLRWFLMIIPFCQACKQEVQDSLKIQGLKAPVEIITDRWGVPHIYASNEEDLFFCQGFQAAKDRLFQLEIFRRRASGTMAEILGPEEVQRDIGARLFKYRGNLDQEYAHYHPNGKAIIQSFVAGINAYIKLVHDAKQPMPVELATLGITPGYWTPEIVISRHNGWVGNVQEELSMVNMINLIGEDKLRTITNFHPHSPDLKLDPALDPKSLMKDVLGPYRDFRGPVQFNRENYMASVKPFTASDPEGSNNWVLSGIKTASGAPIMASDPHRVISVPSIRYLVHLNAPGWNVIGGGEPIIPGVAIGHNETGAWGLTIFDTDTEDLYVYRLNPDNHSQYWYKGGWQQFNIIKDTIKIKNQRNRVVELKFSVHGPVTYLDSSNLVGYAIKAAWLERGCAPYLASLRINQANSWDEFRRACSYALIPAENMVWADKKGDIGWQVVGIAPIRSRYSGMVPVPGDGRYEWDGILPVLERPWAVNPSSGFINTANENTTPQGYAHMNSIAYTWPDSFRAARARELLNVGKKFTMDDMKAIQMDLLSIPARELIPFLKNIKPIDERVKTARHMLMNWDQKLSDSSVAASIYFIFEILVERNLLEKLELVNDSLPQFGISLTRAIRMIKNPAPLMTEAERDEIILMALIGSVSILTERIGADMNGWRYGQEKMKHVYITHPLSSKSNSAFNIGPAPRGGDGNTINSTGGYLNQNFGASVRFIFDCSDWDLGLATNTPGQSGIPDSRHYRDLFEGWSKNQYFPLYFSRQKIATVTESKLKLLPAQ